MKRIVFALAATAFAFPAWADLYRCMDKKGGVTYSVTPPSGPCYVEAKGRASSSYSSPRASSSPSGFPRVDADTQRARDGDRRWILEQELAEQSRLHDEAQRAGAVERVAVHGRNVEMLRRELSFSR